MHCPLYIFLSQMQKQQGASPVLLQQAANIALRQKLGLQVAEHRRNRLAKEGAGGVSMGPEPHHEDSQDEREYVDRDHLEASTSEGSPSKLPLMQLAEEMQVCHGLAQSCWQIFVPFLFLFKVLV